MGTAIVLRADYSAIDLRRLAKASKDADQSRRLLALAEIYAGGSRTRAAVLGDVQLQSVRDWVLRFNGGGPAGLTEHMRIGAVGAMVNHYTAMKVAENFRLLEALFPGRVDLGLGRAPGGERWPDRDYFHHLQHLLELLDEPNDRPGSGRPEVWMLGASAHSARHAAALGLPYSYAHFINQQGGAALMSTYQQAFQTSQYLA